MTRSVNWTASGSAALLLALSPLSSKAAERPGANRPTTNWQVQSCEFTATTWGDGDGSGSFNGAVEYFGSEKNFTDKMPWFGDKKLAITFSREEGGLSAGGVPGGPNADRYDFAFEYETDSSVNVVNKEGTFAYEHLTYHQAYYVYLLDGLDCEVVVDNPESPDIDKDKDSYKLSSVEKGETNAIFKGGTLEVDHDGETEQNFFVDDVLYNISNFGRNKFVFCLRRKLRIWHLNR